MGFVPGEVVAPGDPRIVLEGQWGHQPGLAITVNSGSRISFTFSGTAVQALFDIDGLTSPPHLWVSVDDGEPTLHVVEQPVIELTAETGRSAQGRDRGEGRQRAREPVEPAVRVRGGVRRAGARRGRRGCG